MTLHAQFLRFAIVGGLATALQYFVLVSLVILFDMNPIYASSLGFIVSAGFNYSLNHRYTFQSQLPHRLALPKFIVVAISGLFVNSGMMWMGLFHLHYLLAQMIASVCTLLWNYLLNRLWTFSGMYKHEMH